MSGMIMPSPRNAPPANRLQPMGPAAGVVKQHGSFRVMPGSEALPGALRDDLDAEYVEYYDDGEPKAPYEDDAELDPVAAVMASMNRHHSFRR